jgi:sulfur-oxidizing protein SoxY
MKRRRFLQLTASALAARAGASAAQGLPQAQDITPLIDKITGGKRPEARGVEIEIPALAENGNSVPAKIRVPSPMSPEDHVVAIYIFAARNPRPHVATFHLGPQSGKAEIATRIRLAGTQTLTVLAALSGARFRIGSAEVLVTSAACLDETAG